MKFSNIRLKGNSYFSDKASTLFTLALGISGGIVIGSFTDYWQISFDPVYPSPYRTMVNQTAFIIAACSLVSFLIGYIIISVRSKHILKAHRFIRFILVIIVSCLLTRLFSVIWQGFMNFLHNLKNLFN